MNTLHCQELAHLGSTDVLIVLDNLGTTHDYCIPLTVVH